MENCVAFFFFMTLTTASAQLQAFVSDRQSLCPQQTATFTCTIGDDEVVWSRNGGLVVAHPVGSGTDIIRTGGGARAVIISNNGGVRTSVLLFDSFPTTSFDIGCNEEEPSSVIFAVAPQRPSPVVATYQEIDDFLYFNISFPPPGDAQTNLTYRVQIGNLTYRVQIPVQIVNEVALTEQPRLFINMARNKDSMVTDLNVTVTAINECGQESNSSEPVQAERVSTDMPSTTATTEPSTTTGRVPSTVLMEEIPTPCTKNVVSTGIAAWIVISIALIVILVLCCVGLLVYIIHQKKKVILYLMKRIADLEAKQGQTMSTLSGKQPDN